MKKARIDTPLLISIILLITAGFIIFISASLGLLTRDSIQFGSIAFKQIFFGLIPGLVAIFLFSKLNFMYWRKISFWAFLFGIVLCLIIFIPGVGTEIKGATRWLNLGSISFQVSEVLKIGAIMYFAAWLSSVKDRAGSFLWGFLPLIGMIAIIGGLLLSQPDTDTFIILAATLSIMYFVAGGKWKHLGLLVLGGLLVVALLASQRPYLKDRIMTFVNPADNELTSGYQIQQSLIAIGSGGIAGRGFGQSLQKFNYLPEPVGDSIFAVAAEEFGFVGGVGLISLYLFFGFRSFRIASRASHPFGGLLAVGITSMIIIQSFMNISAMVGIIPLSGMPLLFVSQGGTALLFTIAEAGILLNISRYAKIKAIQS